jgi:hypothetical protein
VSTRPPGERRALRTRLTLAILRLYPRRWRARYEPEMRAILEDHGARGRDLVDLTWGAVRERLRGPNGPDPGEHPFAAAWWRGSILFAQRLALMATVWATAYAAGWVLGATAGPLPDRVAWLVLGSMAAVAIWGLRRGVQGSKWPSSLPVEQRLRYRRHGSWSMLGLVAGLGLFPGWEHDLPSWQISLWSLTWLLRPHFDDAFDFGGRRERLRDASQRYFGNRERLKWAEMELARLEALSYPMDHPDMIRQQLEIDTRRAEMVSAVEILREPDRTGR